MDVGTIQSVHREGQAPIARRSLHQFRVAAPLDYYEASFQVAESRFDADGNFAGVRRWPATLEESLRDLEDRQWRQVMTRIMTELGPEQSRPLLRMAFLRLRVPDPSREDSHRESFYASNLANPARDARPYFEFVAEFVEQLREPAPFATKAQAAQTMLEFYRTDRRLAERIQNASHEWIAAFGKLDPQKQSTMTRLSNEARSALLLYPPEYLPHLFQLEPTQLSTFLMFYPANSQGRESIPERFVPKVEAFFASSPLRREVWLALARVHFSRVVLQLMDELSERVVEELAERVRRDPESLSRNAIALHDSAVLAHVLALQAANEIEQLRAYFDYGASFQRQYLEQSAEARANFDEWPAELRIWFASNVRVMGGMRITTMERPQSWVETLRLVMSIDSQGHNSFTRLPERAQQIFVALDPQEQRRIVSNEEHWMFVRVVQARCSVNEQVTYEELEALIALPQSQRQALSSLSHEQLQQWISLGEEGRTAVLQSGRPAATLAQQLERQAEQQAEDEERAAMEARIVRRITLPGDGSAGQRQDVFLERYDDQHLYVIVSGQSYTWRSTGAGEGDYEWSPVERGSPRTRLSEVIPEDLFRRHFVGTHFIDFAPIGEQQYLLLHTASRQPRSNSSLWTFDATKDEPPVKILEMSSQAGRLWPEPGGTRVAITGRGNPVYMFDSQQPDRLRSTGRSQVNSGVPMSWSPEGGRFVMWAGDSLRIRNAETGRIEQEIPLINAQNSQPVWLTDNRIYVSFYELSEDRRTFLQRELIEFAVE